MREELTQRTDPILRIKRTAVSETNGLLAKCGGMRHVSLKDAVIHSINILNNCPNIGLC